MSTPRKTLKNKSKSANVRIEEVTRNDIERKLEELDEVFQDTANSGKDIAKIAIGIGVVLLLGLAFYSGRRRSLRTKTTVSFFKSI